MSDEADTTSSTGEYSDEQRRKAEAHRGFVREMDTRMGNAYGRGGGVVVLVFFAVVATGWMVGWLGQLVLWLGGITLTLAALYGVRKRIYAHRRKLRKRVDTYCEVNEVSTKMLRDYYDDQQMYPFFAAIYEKEPRRVDESIAGGNSPTKLDAH